MKKRLIIVGIGLQFRKIVELALENDIGVVAVVKNIQEHLALIDYLATSYGDTANSENVEFILSCPLDNYPGTFGYIPNYVKDYHVFGVIYCPAEADEDRFEYALFEIREVMDRMAIKSDALIIASKKKPWLIEGEKHVFIHEESHRDYSLQSHHAQLTIASFLTGSQRSSLSA